MRHFFEEYKTLEKKTVEVEDFQGADVAREIVKQSIIDYQTKIKPGL
jgi:inorganic pyrophosphatase